MAGMSAPKLTIAALLAACCVTAHAQAPDSTSAPVSVNTRAFSLTVNASTPQTKQDSFCLPHGERLVKVVGATSTNSNAASTVDVKGDTATNCITYSAELPAAREICTDVPNPTIQSPNASKKLCTTVPTVLNFSVQYQSAKD